MGVLSNIFGAPGVIEKGFDLIDSFHTSKEEAIEARTKAKVDLMAAYAPFRIAQRVIAIMFTSVFLFSFLLVLTMTILGQGNPDAVIGVVNQFWIGEIMLMIGTFYFGGGFLEGAMEKFNGRIQSKVST